jgi:hypothetical protein
MMQSSCIRKLSSKLAIYINFLKNNKELSLTVSTAWQVSLAKQPPVGERDVAAVADDDVIENTNA